MRGQERCVGLDEDLPIGNQVSCLTQLGGIGKCHSSSKTQKITAIYAFASNVSVTGEAMHDHGVRGALGRQDVEEVVVGLPVVDHQRFADPLGQIDVPGEGSFCTSGDAADSDLPGQ